MKPREAEKRGQVVYPACRQCGSTRGLAPPGVSGDDETIPVGGFQHVTRRAADGVILCGSCDWPLDPQPERYPSFKYIDHVVNPKKES